jgi:hypothetical protein
METISIVTVYYADIQSIYLTNLWIKESEETIGLIGCILRIIVYDASGLNPGIYRDSTKIILLDNSSRELRCLHNLYAISPIGRF